MRLVGLFAMWRYFTRSTTTKIKFFYIITYFYGVTAFSASTETAEMALRKLWALFVLIAQRSDRQSWFVLQIKQLMKVWIYNNETNSMLSWLTYSQKPKLRIIYESRTLGYDAETRSCCWTLLFSVSGVTSTLWILAVLEEEVVVAQTLAGMFARLAVSTN